jgi:hypothetical protein
MGRLKRIRKNARKNKIYCNELKSIDRVSGFANAS